MSGIVGIKQQHIDSRPISAWQWFLVAMCFLVVVADGMDVAIMGFRHPPPILAEWNISRPAFGFVISAAPFGLVLGALVAGPSSDRFGRKIVLVMSILIFGLLTLVSAYARRSRADGGTAFPGRHWHGRRDAQCLHSAGRILAAPPPLP